MISIKSFKIGKQTVNITVEGENIQISAQNKKELAALMLLMGFYNPLRQYSVNDTPIDYELLKKLRQQFENLIYEVQQNMSVVIK